jgi:hypothetical protein
MFVSTPIQNPFIALLHPLAVVSAWDSLAVRFYAYGRAQAVSRHVMPSVPESFMAE